MEMRHYYDCHFLYKPKDIIYDDHLQWQLSPDILGKDGPKCAIIATIIIYTNWTAYSRTKLI